MGRLAEKLDSLVVRALSPDRRIRGQLTQRSNIEISFADEEAYYDYESEQKLASQLGSVFNALLVGRLEGFRASVRDTTDLSIDDEPHWDANRRRFRAERDGTLLEGKSDDGWIRIVSTGLRDAKVIIESGAFEELDEPSFVVETQSAIADLWDDHGFVMDMLRREYLE